MPLKGHSLIFAVKKKKNQKNHVVLAPYKRNRKAILDVNRNDQIRFFALSRINLQFLPLFDLNTTKHYA